MQASPAQLPHPGRGRRPGSGRSHQVGSGAGLEARRAIRRPAWPGSPRRSPSRPTSSPAARPLETPGLDRSRGPGPGRGRGGHGRRAARRQPHGRGDRPCAEPARLARACPPVLTWGWVVSATDARRARATASTTWSESSSPPSAEDPGQGRPPEGRRSRPSGRPVSPVWLG
jgi:hypothetical protein